MDKRDELMAILNRGEVVKERPSKTGKYDGLTFREGFNPVRRHWPSIERSPTRGSHGPMKTYDTAIVVGGGAFGTSMASVIAHNFKRVVVKVRSRDVYDAMLKGKNSVYLPEITLAPEIAPAFTWNEAMKTGKVELIVIALPTAAISSYCREYHTELKAFLEKGIPFVSLSKGIDSETLELPDELYFKSFKHFPRSVLFSLRPKFCQGNFRQTNHSRHTGRTIATHVWIKRPSCFRRIFLRFLNPTMSGVFCSEGP